MAFKVGDRVSWSSQAGGFIKVKYGDVVAVVPARAPPGPHRAAVVERLGCGIDRCDGGGLMRRHESYLVLVAAGGGKARPKLYWPVVSRLKKVE